MKPLIVALDVDTDKQVFSLIKQTKKHVDLYKVGPTLVLKYGPSLLKKIRSLGKKIFLDLKFHDIPNTMARSVMEAARSGVYGTTVHASAAGEALKTVMAAKPRPKIWGVTVLTSMGPNDLDDLGIDRSPLEQTRRLAALAKAKGLDGLVCSVNETAELRKIVGESFTIITPGIRMPDNNVGDQKRVATPAGARAAGADFIVVGRPIIESKNPADAAERIMDDWNS